MANLGELRESYTWGALEEASTLDDPLAQFHVWFSEVLSAGVREPNAMTLATVGTDGLPNARVVLLKHLDSGFVFFTNYDSVKGMELAGEPRAALCFHWKELERQVRARGTVSRVSAEESDAYFTSRPRESQLGAWASAQSTMLSNREELEQRFREAERRFPDAVPRPPHWGGFRLIPSEIEFWQGRTGRMHDRLLYTRTEGAWLRRRLAP